MGTGRETSFPSARRGATQDLPPQRLTTLGVRWHARCSSSRGGNERHMRRMTKLLLALGAALLFSLSPATGQGGVGGGGGLRPPSGNGGPADGGGAGSGGSGDTHNGGDTGGGTGAQPSGGGDSPEGGRAGDNEREGARDEQSSEHADETAGAGEEATQDEEVAAFYMSACDEYSDGQ